jgi:hypothetical protein
MDAATARRTGFLLSCALCLFLLALWLREPVPARPPGVERAIGGTTLPSDGEPRMDTASEPAMQIIDGSASTDRHGPGAASITAAAADAAARAHAADSGAADAAAGGMAMPPKRAETQRWFAPVARARTYGELAAALAALPGDEDARRELLEPIARWCRTAAQEVYDTEAFQRYAPLRWHALMELRAFCVDAPDRSPLAGDWIQPLGMTVLMHFGRQTLGRIDPAQGADAGRAALRGARQLVDQANALQWMQTQGFLSLDPALGCQRNCGPYYWAAAMLIACQDAGGCGYRSPVTLGYCAANFGGGGCRPGADYGTALRDRLSQADWQRVQRAVQELHQSLATPE